MSWVLSDHTESCNGRSQIQGRRKVMESSACGQRKSVMSLLIVFVTDCLAMVQIVILGKFSIPTECTPTMKTSRMLQGVSQGAYLGIVPHTHLIFLQGKDTDNFSNNRSDAGINLSFEVKIILNGSGKCFLDSVSI